jgi:hypothetical protein
MESPENHLKNISDSPENNLIKLQTEKEITVLYKSLFEIIEDIKREHINLLNRAKLNVDEEFIQSLDYFNDTFSHAIRKKLLDRSNASIRNLLTFLSYFDFKINNEKLIEACKTRKIVHRTHHNNSTYSVEN